MKPKYTAKDYTVYKDGQHYCQTIDTTEAPRLAETLNNAEKMRAGIESLELAWRSYSESAERASLAMSNDAFLSSRKRMDADFKEFERQLAALRIAPRPA